MGRARLATVFGALLLGACSSAKAAPPPPREDPQPKLFDMRRQAEARTPQADPAKCAHVWEQRGIHPYERIENGIPMTEICVMTRCVKCGLVRHECGAR